tara:strand:+ start:2499 stop:2669 length:171 start_codon:yes stop_codon:yes gene_type:complete
MGKITKSQAKRLIKAIRSKAQRLYIGDVSGNSGYDVVTAKDMEAVERLTNKWLKRV